ncbi:MAG: phosphoenolpyruvate carboxykinase (ATP) [Acidobacteria bacterium]|nr:phosphoenolpyruvate carboxykinase (ATP) [Acidobacteriota bacterium]MBI3657890.1 phosphoenolpyruvate carboxykinase (ATP) [Acidobacteriota bacterium]
MITREGDSISLNHQLYKVKVYENPTQEELKGLTLKHTPATCKTVYGSINKISRNKDRKAQWTYIITPETHKDRYSGNLIDPEKAKLLIESQRRYIEKVGALVQIDGYLGIGRRAVPVRWLYTPEGSNIAAMQQILSFPRTAVETREQLAEGYRPDFHIVYTPGHRAEGMPGNQAIVVDLENYVTYIIGPDYFGESKKSALRMLNDYVYQRGGLVLHAGAKVVKAQGRLITMTIMGLSGTGKTTTTFSKQGDLTQPVQDDMVGFWPNGECSVTENGCFAKTFGLTRETEPAIYDGTTSPTGWIENAYFSPDGTLDFSKGRLTPEEVRFHKDILIQTGASPENVEAYLNHKIKYENVVDANDIPRDGWDFVLWTQNGRSVFPLSAIKEAADLHNIPSVGSMGILNRDEGKEAAMPGILRFVTPEQAAGYFMLGETSKTSAAGKARGKTRSPFTQPFFPRPHGLQAQRFSEIAKTVRADMWLMNTGYIGGDQKDVEAGLALKVKIRHSSAMLEAMLAGAIGWTVDTDFGYQIVDVKAPENARLLAQVPDEILNPKLFYERRGRLAEYQAWVVKMKQEREAFLRKYNVAEGIIRAVLNRVS